MEDVRREAALRTTRLHLGMEVMETLKKVEEFPDNPSSMNYFYTFFRELFSKEVILPQDQQVVATMCVQVPDELIYAAGARPFRLCSGAYAYVDVELMPAKSCPLVKATSGMLHINRPVWADKISSLVIPTTCDQKKKTAELAGDLGYPVYSLEMPSAKESDAARFYWQESIKQFAYYLQKITGKKITRNNLQHAISQKLDASKLYRKLHKLQTAASPVIYGKDMLLVTNAFFLDDQKSWVRAAEKLLLELEERHSQDFSLCSATTPRLLFTGSPPVFPNIKVPIMAEQSGAVMVADESCSSSRLLYDAVSYDEKNLDDMIPAVADRYLKPCTCPCLSPNEDRKRKIIEMVEKCKIDGVIYQAYSGCLPYEIEQMQIASVLAKVGIPMLYVETDYSPEDQGQLSTRIEAFIESIKMKKRKRSIKKQP